MKVAITGATGFVGQNLTKYLQSHDINEIVKIGRVVAPGQNDITIQDFLKSPVKYDVIVHLAGKAHDLKNTSERNAYFEVNYELTRRIFEHFQNSQATTFIYISSVKAVADVPIGIVKEDIIPVPGTAYGESKLKAEHFLTTSPLTVGKNMYILRPCMIHGPGNKGNLNLLIKLVLNNIPYPLGLFNNKRSFLAVDNLCFAIHQLITTPVASGVYNVADDESLSTCELIKIISEVMGKKARILKINKKLVYLIAKLGGALRLPLNEENLLKLTTDYVVSNDKIKQVLTKPFPLSTREGLVKTLEVIKGDLT